jgi:hypothetical protein
LSDQFHIAIIPYTQTIENKIQKKEGRISSPLLIAHLRRTPVQVSRCEAMLMKARGFHSANLMNEKKITPRKTSKRTKR